LAPRRHDCVVGAYDLRNNATLGGHVVVEDRRISRATSPCIILPRRASGDACGLARVIKDVPRSDHRRQYRIRRRPEFDRLRRAGYTTEEIAQLKARIGDLSQRLKWQQITARLQADSPRPRRAFHRVHAPRHARHRGRTPLAAWRGLKLSEEAIVERRFSPKPAEASDWLRGELLR